MSNPIKTLFEAIDEFLKVLDCETQTANTGQMIAALPAAKEMLAAMEAGLDAAENALAAMEPVPCRDVRCRDDGIGDPFIRREQGGARRWYVHLPCGHGVISFGETVPAAIAAHSKEQEEKT